MIIAIIQIIIFTAYVLFVWLKVGVQKSISESYYTLMNYHEKSKN